MKKISVEILLEKKSRPSEVIRVSPEMGARHVARLMKDHNVGLIVVVENEVLIGVVSERDIVRRWVADKDFPKDITVRDIMTSDVEVITASDNLYDCYLRFVARNCRHLPVLDATGTVMGVLSLRDVARYVVGDLQKN